MSLSINDLRVAEHWDHGGTVETMYRLATPADIIEVAKTIEGAEVIWWCQYHHRSLVANGRCVSSDTPYLMHNCSLIEVLVIPLPVEE